MQSPWIASAAAEDAPRSWLRCTGQRAVIEFAPKLTSAERLCAGVVLRTADGLIRYRCAVDAKKAEHAFGEIGHAFVSMAQALCESLAEHWLSHGTAETWAPPFEGARLARLAPFSAKDEDAALQLALNQHSSLHLLLGAYEIASNTRQPSIVHRVRKAVQQNLRNKHFAVRFERDLTIGSDDQTLRVDFLGQHFACYFIEATRSERGVAGSAEHAFGKLYELQALRRFVQQRPDGLGLLQEERPHRFELLVVGDRQHPIQRRAMDRIEALADQGEVIARPLPNAGAAAEHLADMERRAA